MKELTGEQFNVDGGIIVVCDPGCMENVRIPVGEHVIYNNEEFVFAGVVMGAGHSTPEPNPSRWPVMLRPIP
ncbi:MAG: hypothetical protein IJQ43_04775 [Oscillospiraceae bacterium]|nr:hypothetical protein [Oscillospiraceae bacterium]